ncbi:MAG: nitrous oxide-stimulated promoter family protein [Candidatus Thiodiazotropha sp. (ex Dulcina madagascariensis)]|nr:nitrous oxide-stimulated promoter family protein [Candidatus Thiodiazotropha sp. (ex Dulcina madagascariensis)]MCU7927492.1 nitrous oxide-stimulated promoter family protein [Candidatus Thiodiazotropha sp. (ex Dulcina madagascariensis)]
MINNRIRREQQTIAAMMAIYCADHHQTRGVLCETCAHLLDYARRRLDSCPFQSEKPACNHCTVHCYSKEMRGRVQDVMRYAGPRMTFRHPVLSLYHLYDKFRKEPELPKPKR